MTWLYAIYSIALGIWTYQSVGKYGVLAHGTYIVLVSILLITGIAAGLVWRKKKVIRDGVFIALILINIGCSLAYRTNTDALYGYFADTGFMISIFFLVYVVVRYTRIYQNKLLNLIGMMALPVILISTRFVSEPVNGAYIYFFGIQIFGLTLMGYPFVVAEFMSMPEKKYLNRSVRSLSFNLLGLLLYTLLLFLGCAICKEYGLLLVLAMTATIIFFIRCKNGTTKMLYSAACMMGAFLITKVANHVQERVEIWMNLENVATNDKLAVKAETTLYLFRHFKRMGWWGNGIGDLSRSVYVTLNSDHAFTTLLNDYGLVLTALVLIIGAVFVRWMLYEKPGLNLYDSYLNLSSGLICGFILLIHVASNLGSFITAGLGYPWCSNGTVTNIMFTVLLAIHCGILGRKEVITDEMEKKS